MGEKRRDSDGDEADGRQNRMAVGIALGLPIGVALSLIMENWGLLGIGVALGVSFGLLASPKDRTAEDAGSAAEDRDR